LSAIIKLKFKVAVPLFGNIEHHDDSMGAFVHVDKVSIQTGVVCKLQQTTGCHKNNWRECTIYVTDLN